MGSMKGQKGDQGEKGDGGGPSGGGGASRAPPGSVDLCGNGSPACVPATACPLSSCGSSALFFCDVQGKLDQPARRGPGATPEPQECLERMARPGSPGSQVRSRVPGPPRPELVAGKWQPALLLGTNPRVLLCYPRTERGPGHRRNPGRSRSPWTQRIGWWNGPARYVEFNGGVCFACSGRTGLQENPCGPEGIVWAHASLPRCTSILGPVGSLAAGSGVLS